MAKARTELDSQELAREVARLADSKLADDIVVLDMRDLVAYTDFLVIATARNEEEDVERYRVTVEDHFWRWLYVPIADLAQTLARWIGLMQQGRISVYLLYSFMTLVATLLVVMR